jgi:hypothetical protein
MPNVLYPKWKEAVIQGGANSSLGGNVVVILVDAADYTYNASHQFFTDLPVAARVAVSSPLASKTYLNGLFDAADITWASVSGDQSEIVIIGINTGSDATSRLVAFFDTGVTGLPVTPNSGNIDVQFNAGGIFNI